MTRARTLVGPPAPFASEPPMSTLLPRRAWRAPALLPLLLSACLSPEAGVDRTVVEGQIDIPAVIFSEQEAGIGVNDDPLNGALSDLGELRYANLRVLGRALCFRERPNGTPTGDADWYLLRATSSGPINLTLLYEAGEGASGDTAALDTGGAGPEAQRYVVSVYDMAQLDENGIPAMLFEGATDGAGGAFVVPVEVPAGAELLIGVQAGAATVGAADYEREIDGDAPNAAGFKAGIYAGGTLADRGAPLGGAAAELFVDDPATRTRSAPFRAYGTTPVTREDETPALGEQLPKAYVWAGNFPDLNAGITAGTMFSSQPVEIEADAAGEVRLRWIDREIRPAFTVSVDTVQPIVVGWEATDAEPNNVEVDANYTVLSGTPQELPAASGPGFVDIVRGRVDYPAADPSWAGENDSFTLSVPEGMGVVATLSWADTAYNLDMNWNAADGSILGAGWDVGDVNPERFDTIANYGVVLEPGTTYTLTLLPWSGPAGGVDYELTLEWLAP